MPLWKLPIWQNWTTTWYFWSHAPIFIFLEVNTFIWSTMKVQFNENIYDMYQCPPNLGFTSIKVQNVDFLKKPSVDNIFFLFNYVLLIHYHHLRAKLGMYIALSIFLNFWQVWWGYSLFKWYEAFKNKFWFRPDSLSTDKVNN